MSSQERRPVRKADYQPPDFLVESIELDLALDTHLTRVHSRLRLFRNPAGRPDAPLWLDGEGLDLKDIRLDDTPLPADAFALDSHGLRVPSVPEHFTLSTEVTINPAGNTALLGLYQAGELLCTQCEPEAFRRITFFPDRPDVLARYRVTLTADAERYPVLLANGDLLQQEALPDGRHRAVWEDPFPKPSYLFAIVAGNPERVSSAFTTASGRDVALNLHVHRRNTGRCDHALDTLRRAMAWDEQTYGREYDLSVFNMLAVSEYTMGAMENKGLNIFNDRRVLTDASTGTDRDHRDIEALVAHEYFHNWTGNRVTCRDWFQLALKEGFTVFREQQFVADQGWGEVRRIEDTRVMRTRQFAEDAGPLAHPVRPEAYEDIEVFYSDTVYSKGAELIRMLAALAGEERFRAATDAFFERHDGQAVTVEDFVRCVAEATGRDLSQFMAWYDRPGTPTVAVTGAYDAATASYELTLRQIQAPGIEATVPPLHLPLAVGLLDDTGRSLPLRLEDESEASGPTRTLEITDTETRIRFVDVPTPPTPALLRGFSAPVRMQFDYDRPQLVRLAVHDPDAVTRWDAVQRLTDTTLDDALAESEGAPDTTDLETVFQAILNSETDQPLLAAELLAPPEENALIQQRDGVDVAALLRAHRAVAGTLGTRLGAQFAETHAQCRTPPATAYRATPEACGRRALANVCLGYLMAAGGDEALIRCLDQYYDGATLTERLAALGLLCHGHGPERDAALANFYRRWQHEPMMLDKWLAVQARASRDDAVEQVQALTRHPAFSLDQPNRVRSLIEVFAAENPYGFHRADGAGYRLLAEQVLALDPRNPSLAAALLRQLGDWRRHDPPRSRLMRSALKHIAAAPSLSTGTREVVEACLAPSTVPDASK